MLVSFLFLAGRANEFLHPRFRTPPPPCSPATRAPSTGFSITEDEPAPEDEPCSRHIAASRISSKNL